METDKKSIILNLYCDEIKEYPLKIPFINTFEKWTYIGMLIVPEFISDKLYKDLINLRCLSQPPKPWGSCSEPCPYHNLNNTEIHYQNTDDSIKYKIASNWVKYWLDDRENIYFYILGINLTKLDLDKFGPKKQKDKHSTIYNRFFRTALKRALKTYFRDYDNIIVKNIFHDKGNAEYHEYFPWHSIYKLQSEEDKIYFANNHIKFINSDHRKPDGDPVHSQFIQFIDIILGCFANSLHLNATSKNKYSLTVSAFPIISRIIKNPNNPNSRYNYYKRQMVQFFPKEDLKGMDEQSLEYRYKKLNQFYTNRELPIERKINGQLSIFDF
ncbi:hypothetical protein Q2T46_13770 [Thermoanaerobacterium sp. CMT5567-10]|uniref:hypothetical protein n=1 Tax=Thermoanaerobacterium sp. CMT5567-10 TaxID=3061989 RepID=UPI0026E080E5|nr:hypothetical protein [Thermoanaerobacterium sp. CMT5567-10]WKV08580.1 hypothetical protein Q2T46_13770 [Thermoanaerobacterium sp. CMT5567-10]